MVCFLHRNRCLPQGLVVVQALVAQGLGQELAWVWAEESPHQVYIVCTTRPLCTCHPARSIHVQKNLGHHTAPITWCRDLELASVHLVVLVLDLGQADKLLRRHSSRTPQHTYHFLGCHSTTLSKSLQGDSSGTKMWRWAIQQQ